MMKLKLLLSYICFFDVRGIRVDIDTNVFIRTNDLYLEDLVKSKNSEHTKGMSPVLDFPLWF